MVLQYLRDHLVGILEPARFSSLVNLGNAGLPRRRSQHGADHGGCERKGHREVSEHEVSFQGKTEGIDAHHMGQDRRIFNVAINHASQ